MNENDLYRSLQEIDDDILERSEGNAKKNLIKKLVIVAMCLGLLMVIGVIAIYVDLYLESKGKPVYVDENSTYGIIQKLETKYNKTAVATEEEFDFLDEDIRLYEQCIIVEFEDRKYYKQSSGAFKAVVDESLLGDVIGVCEAKSSYNNYMDVTFSVRRICNVSSDFLIAVKIGEVHYVFRNKLYGVDTLGEMFDYYGLLHFLELKRFELDDNYYILEEDTAILEMLFACSDAKFVWGSRENNTETICFTVTSEALGMYKEEFSISAEGYVSTSMLIHEGAFFIGEEAASEIISYAKENSQKTGYEPHQYRLAGTLEAIGENFIFMNDALFCRNSEDGMTFRIEMDDVWFQYYFESGYLKIGDEFILDFSGEVDMETGTIELGPAFSVKKAKAAGKEEELGFFDFLKKKCKTYIRNELLKNDPRYFHRVLDNIFAGLAD